MKILKSDDPNFQPLARIIPVQERNSIMMENAEPPSVHVHTHMTQESPPERVMPPPPKHKEYVALQTDDGDWMLLTTDGNDAKHLTEREAKQCASMLNEQGSN